MKNFNTYLAIKKSSVVLALLVIVAELWPAFKTFLASITGHHWSAKAVIVTLIYIAIGMWGKKKVSDSVAYWWVVASLTAMLLLYMILYSSHS